MRTTSFGNNYNTISTNVKYFLKDLPFEDKRLILHFLYDKIFKEILSKKVGEWFEYIC